MVRSLLANSKYSQRVLLKDILVRRDGGSGILGQKLVVGGWVKSVKEVPKKPVPPSEKTNIPGGSKKDGNWLKIFCGKDTNQPEKHPPDPPIFVTITDGSCVAALQIVVKSSLARSNPLLPGTCILIEGTLRRPPYSPCRKHVIELIAEKFLHTGIVDQKEYPLSTNGIPLQDLRDWSHFRPRTTMVGSVTRIRSAMTISVHSFFKDNGFIYVQLPTITTTSAAGFGEKFLVTTDHNKDTVVAATHKKTKESVSTTEPSIDGDNNQEKAKEQASTSEARENEKSKPSIDGDNKQEKAKEQASTSEARENDKSKPSIDGDNKQEKTKEQASTSEARENDKSKPSIDGDNKKVSKDFFPQQTYLSVTGRLHLESYACALGNVYSCGPRFRADMIDSSKRCAEMWMVETEIAFSQMEDVIECAVDLLKFLCKGVLDNCSIDMDFVTKRIDKTSKTRLQSTISSVFQKITYTETVKIFKNIADPSSTMKITWGDEFTTEHLRYLADEIYQKPLIIYDYPKEVKPFYVRQNDDGKTVAAFELIVPKAGTVISGSQNEERLDKLKDRIKELNLREEEYEWYLQLRQHGTVEHSGFSLSLDSFLLFVAGLPDVREAIPFPRSYGEAKN